MNERRHWRTFGLGISISTLLIIVGLVIWKDHLDRVATAACQKAGYDRGIAVRGDDGGTDYSCIQFSYMTIMPARDQ